MVGIKSVWPTNPHFYVTLCDNNCGKLNMNSDGGEVCHAFSYYLTVISTRCKSKGPVLSDLSANERMDPQHTNSRLTFSHGLSSHWRGIRKRIFDDECTWLMGKMPLRRMCLLGACGDLGRSMKSIQEGFSGKCNQLGGLVRTW